MDKGSLIACALLLSILYWLLFAELFLAAATCLIQRTRGSAKVAWKSVGVLLLLFFGALVLAIKVTEWRLGADAEGWVATGQVLCAYIGLWIADFDHRLDDWALKIIKLLLGEGE